MKARRLLVTSYHMHVVLLAFDVALNLDPCLLQAERTRLAGKSRAFLQVLDCHKQRAEPHRIAAPRSVACRGLPAAPCISILISHEIPQSFAVERSHRLLILGTPLEYIVHLMLRVPSTKW